MANTPTIDDAELSRSRVELLRYALAACTRNGLAPQLAEDLVHEAIIELYESHGRGEPPSCSQIAFLKRTIWHRAIDRIRGTKRRSALLRDNHEHVPKAQTPIDDDAVACAQIAQQIFDHLAVAAEVKGADDAWCYLEALRDDPTGTRKARMQAAGLTPDRYEAAKKRVAVLLSHIPTELEDNARDILGVQE